MGKFLQKSLAFEPWPDFDENLARENEVEFAISVNGKLRATISAPSEIGKEEMLQKAREHEKLQKWLDGKTILKEIFVPGKIVNLVVK
jgi:leucyl-tRNA synthetase